MRSFYIRNYCKADTPPNGSATVRVLKEMLLAENVVKGNGDPAGILHKRFSSAGNSLGFAVSKRFVFIFHHFLTHVMRHFSCLWLVVPT